MSRSLAAVSVALLASAASAHFAFIVPEGEGPKAKVVFSDTTEADPNVNVEKIADTKLFVRDATGKDQPLEWSKGDACYLLHVPGTGPRAVHGTTDYGVLQKGEGKPFWLLYHSKAILGLATKGAILGERCPLEIVPVGGPGKVRFLVQASGKSLPDAEITVLLPGGGKKAAMTDKEGFTAPFEQTGRFAAHARRSEGKAGEHAGRKYDEVRHYATLVVTIGEGK